ncbi:MAG TPA: barstar family protein [Burkholderiaceae bacterium]|nr:barstar family protein [Burkholderiaceae bacterium]
MGRTPTSLADLPSNAVRPLGALSPEALRSWAQAAQHRFVHVILTGIRERRPLLATIGRALEFPSWFGANLDALYDSLTDMPERLPAAGYVVVLDGLMRGPDNDDNAAVLDVFRDAAEEFAGRGVALRVYYR